MGSIKRLALFLTHEDATQRAWAATVRDAARVQGLEFAEHWDVESGAQNHAIAEAIFGDTADALLILPAVASGPAALLSQAAEKGKAIVLLDHVTHDLDPDVSWSLPRIRRAHPGLLAVRVAPDEDEIGRVQGRQVLALLPAGGGVLCVQGDARTPGAMGRTAGLEEILRGRAQYNLGRVDGGWSAARAETAVQDWLKVMLLNAGYRLGLVVSQSEVMLEGIRRALERLGHDLDRADLARVPMTGCDGLPEFKRAVDAGQLAATVEIPSRTEAAMQVLIDYAVHGTVPRRPEVSLAPASYPTLDQLARRAAS